MPQIKMKALAPEEALKYFRGKDYVLPDDGFNWQDVWQEEHARGFTVAKATSTSLLQDIRRSVDKALAEGLTLEQFQNDLYPKLKTHGWWGRKKLLDPKTGRLVNAQLGSFRRMKIIYDTNLRMARSAGRWERFQRTAGSRPWLVYSAVLDGRTRPEHKSWHAIVLPMDHAFWDTHFPPNGWNCRCIARQMSDRELARKGLTPSNDKDLAPFNQTFNWTNKRTGEVHAIPNGIDPGFDYNVGKAHMRGITPPPRSGPLPQPWNAGKRTDRPRKKEDFEKLPAAEQQRIIDQETVYDANLPPMPKARPMPPEKMLPRTISEDEALDAFLAEFNIKRGEIFEFRDKTGHPMIISERMFFGLDGKVKLEESRRRASVKLIAEAIKDPDEIWVYWEYFSELKRWELRRRFITVFEVEGKKTHVLNAFDVGASGWLAKTGFVPTRKTYLNKNRVGTLLYRRDDSDDGQ